MGIPFLWAPYAYWKFLGYQNATEGITHKWSLVFLVIFMKATTVKTFWWLSSVWFSNLVIRNKKSHFPEAWPHYRFLDKLPVYCPVAYSKVTLLYEFSYKLSFVLNYLSFLRFKDCYLQWQTGPCPPFYIYPVLCIPLHNYLQRH